MSVPGVFDSGSIGLIPILFKKYVKIGMISKKLETDFINRYFYDFGAKKLENFNRVVNHNKNQKISKFSPVEPVKIFFKFGLEKKEILVSIIEEIGNFFHVFQFPLSY